ncbi:MAG: type VI secretion system tube protein Hcp [Planctomycetaceae bacterium]|nr:type VI secretion system tube protein Hcp [Planctomycetaceae bacterium]
MALNAHLALFTAYDTPAEGKPTSTEELTGNAVPGASTVVADIASDANNIPWVVLTSLQYNIRRINLGTNEYGSISHSGMELEKVRDEASPLLTFHAAAQTRFASCKIVLLDANNDLVETIRLYGCRIESISVTCDATGVQHEKCVLTYEQMHLIHDTVGKGWNSETNSEFIPNVAPTP